MIKVANASKSYPRGTHAVDRVSLDVARGEFVSILGPSGCGKSTLLRMIAGLIPSSAGTITAPWISGRAADASLGFVFQEPTLLPWSTVWDNVFLPLRLAKQSRNIARSAIDEALAMVGLSEFASAFPRELSGGMKMRVAVARALATRPQALLLDEPFAALDEITRNRIDDDLLRLWGQQQWAALFVTHSVYEAVYLSTRIAVMSARPGRIVEEILVDLPRPRTAALRGTPKFAAICSAASAALERASTAA